MLAVAKFSTGLTVLGAIWFGGGDQAEHLGGTAVLCTSWNLLLTYLIPVSRVSIQIKEKGAGFQSQVLPRSVRTQEKTAAVTAVLRPTTSSGDAP